MFDFAFAWKVLPTLLKALIVTVQATLGGMALALLVGLGWAMMRRSPKPIVAKPADWIVEFVRSTPLLVQIYFFFYVLPDAGLTFTPLLTGIFALGLHYSAYAAEVYRAGIEAVPKGQWEAATALNLSRYRTWRDVVLPQAIPPIVPALGNYLVAMFKDTPLLATITVLEVLQTAKLVGSDTFRYLEPLTLVGVLFLVLSLTAARLIRLVEVRLHVAH